MSDSSQSNGRSGNAQIIDNRPCFFKYITAIARTWGIMTSIALWYISIQMIRNDEEVGYVQWYALALAITVTFFEMVWILTKCACCKDDGNCCCTVWRITLWVDNWKKSVFYILISLPTFSKLSLGIISGGLVVLLGFCYLVKTCKYSNCIKSRRREAQYVETECPRAGLVSHEVQTSSSTFSPAGQTFTTQQETGPEKNGGSGPSDHSTKNNTPQDPQE